STCADFVFQAEDGIRHFHVTGVQTCALPIFLRSVVHYQSAPTAASAAARISSSLNKGTSIHGSSSTICCNAIRMFTAVGVPERRSEERRVGKKGHFWWVQP